MSGIFHKIAGNWTRMVREWSSRMDTIVESRLCELKGHQEFRQRHYPSPHGKAIASGSQNKVMLWDAVTWKLLYYGKVEYHNQIFCSYDEVD